jgi:hypothetical protein
VKFQKQFLIPVTDHKTVKVRMVGQRFSGLHHERITTDKYEVVV